MFFSLSGYGRSSIGDVRWYVDYVELPNLSIHVFQGILKLCERLKKSGSGLCEVRMTFTPIVIMQFSIFSN